MRLLFVATLHHPAELERARRAAPPGEDPLFPPSQAQYFWARALRRLGHQCAVFWRSESAWPWARSGQLRMTQRLTVSRALGALAARFPYANPDFRLRNRRLIRFAGECDEAAPADAGVAERMVGAAQAAPAAMPALRRKRRRSWPVP